MALVGAETSFDTGRKQLDWLAGIEVTAKAVERHAEAIGADIAAPEQQEIGRAKQLELPAVCPGRASLLYRNGWHRRAGGEVGDRRPRGQS